MGVNGHHFFARIKSQYNKNALTFLIDILAGVFRDFHFKNLVSLFDLHSKMYLQMYNFQGCWGGGH